MKPTTQSDWAQKADLWVWVAAVRPSILSGRAYIAPKIRMTFGSIELFQVDFWKITERAPTIWKVVAV